MVLLRLSLINLHFRTQQSTMVIRVSNNIKHNKKQKEENKHKDYAAAPNVL